jgi:hypothetical protein
MKRRFSVPRFARDDYKQKKNPLMSYIGCLQYRFELEVTRVLSDVVERRVRSLE